MDFDWSTGALARGLACYLRGEYFEAHEHWEDLWRQAEGLEKTLLQALIQITVALCHFQRGNCTGAVSLFQKSLQRLERCPDELAGLDVVRLRAAVRCSSSSATRLQKLCSEPTAPPRPREIVPRPVTWL